MTFSLGEVKLPASFSDDDLEQLEPSCRVCGCTDDDCSGCVERTGEPCYWVEPDLCSACAQETLVGDGR